MKLLKHLWSFHQEQVKSAAQKSDEESEHVAEQFLNGEMDLDTFLSAYTQKRMVSVIDIYLCWLYQCTKCCLYGIDRVRFALNENNYYR